MANYVLTVKLDPAQLNAQLQRITNAFGTAPGGSGGGGLKGALGRFQNALNALQQSKSGNFGKFASFGIMALGIGELVKLVKGLFSMVVDSSPMLKAMMGLLNNSIMFILRPIGDFIGFMLRPILLVFMRYIAIPFYKHFAPIMQKYGTVLGEGIANFLTLAIAFFSDPGGTIVKAFSDAFQSIDISKIFKGLPDFSKFKLTDITKPIQDAITGLFGNLKLPDLSTVLNLDNIKAFWKTFVGFFSNISSTIGGAIKNGWDLLSSFWEGINNGIKQLMLGWDKFYGFLSGLGKDVGGVLNTVWNAIVNGFKTMANFFVDIYNNAISWLKGLPVIGGAFSGLHPAKRFANGGIINEPVVGVGQRSGQGYLLGENGAETVTPGVGGVMGGITINFNAPVYGVNDLRKAVLSILQESDSRRRRM